MEKDLLSRLQLADGETTSGTAYRHPMLAELQPGKDSVTKGIRSLR
jgi:hypothetical protein